MGKREGIYYWGIVGQSTEAEAFATALNELVDAKLQAVAGLDEDINSSYAHLSAAPQAHMAFEDLILEEHIDLVYVASPIAERPHHIKAALSCKKGVVYGSPLSLDAGDLEKLFLVAKEKNMLLLEGMYARFLPAMQRISEVVGQGSIGEVLSLQADASHHIPFDPQHPFFDAEAGGILQQHGLYPVFFVTALLGAPEQISGHLHIGVTGIEEQYALVMRYDTGIYALLSASCTAHGPCEAHITGSKSRVHLHAPFYGETMASLYTRDRPSGLLKFHYAKHPYQYLIDEAQRCYESAQYESSHWGQAHTQLLAQTLERCRKETQIHQESPSS